MWAWEQGHWGRTDLGCSDAWGQASGFGLCSMPGPCPEGDRRGSATPLLMRWRERTQSRHTHSPVSPGRRLREDSVGVFQVRVGVVTSSRVTVVGEFSETPTFAKRRMIDSAAQSQTKETKQNSQWEEIRRLQLYTKGKWFASLYQKAEDCRK